jgi:hypothetical protein
MEAKELPATTTNVRYEACQIITCSGQRTDGPAPPRESHRWELPWMSLVCTGRLLLLQFQQGSYGEL